jgi:integrase
MPKLNKTLIDNTRPEAADVWVWDSEVEGFGIRVKPSGRKTYVVRYRTKDTRTQRKQTLGRCSDFPPEKAREMARKVFAQVAEGGDPGAPREPAFSSVATVGRMFEGYVASMKAKGRASADEVERALLLAKDNAADALGRHRAAAEVSPGDVVAYVAKAYQRGHRGAADKSRSYIASAFAWAMKSANDYTSANRQDWGITRNPAADVPKDTGAIKTRDRALVPAELRQLWKATAIDADGFGREAGACIRLLICCGQRVQETLRIEGKEIDLEAGLWKMPAHKTKGGKHPHTVPLPSQALPVLRELMRRHGDGPLFPARTGSAGIIRHRSINQAISRWLERPDVGLAAFQTRDLRRTWKSRTADAGIDRFTRDLIQQHAKHDTGSKSYDRADYLPQMREAMGKWSAWLDSVLREKVERIRAA